MKSTNKRVTVQLSLALLVFAVVALPALAQNPENGRGPNLQDMPEFRAKGTIKAMAPGMLQVEVSEKESWIVQLLPNNRGTRFIGSAEPDWLMPGMWVNFTTRFNKKGQAVEPVKLLMVFTPGSYRGGEEGQYQPGVKPLTNPGAEISFSGEEKVKPKEDTVLCEVTGQIQGLGKGAIAVVAGMVPVQVSVTEETTVSVDVGNLGPARIGDTVEVNGRTPAPGKGYGTRVEVKGATPLTSKPAQTEGAAKGTTKETRQPTSDTTTKTSPSTGAKKLPLLGKKPAPVEQKTEVEKTPEGE